jgi:hypothetical protein
MRPDPDQFARPDPEQFACRFDEFEDYCHALRSLPWLTPGEYACLLQQDIAYGEENYAEHLTQYRSECAMFGDAGPGQGLALREMSASLAERRAALKRVQAIIAQQEAAQ